MKENNINNLKWIDTHAHYNTRKLNNKKMIEEQFSTNEKIITLGTNTKTNLDTLVLISLYENMYGMIGFFPTDCFEIEPECYPKELAEDNLLIFTKQLLNQKIVGIGEIGLDYHWNNFGKNIKGIKAREYQMKWLRYQLDLAKKLNKPVSLHSRDAKEDTIKIFDEYDNINGVVHCFSYDLNTAEKFLNKGLYLGIGGTSTYPSNKELRNVIKEIPLDKILLETDAPYLSPNQVRRETNQSKYINYIINNICEIKGLEKHDVIKQTNLNANTLFKFQL